MDRHDKAVFTYIKENVKIPDNVKRMASLASWDLWYGPLTYCETCGADHLDDCECGDLKYPGFEAACAIVSEWADENIESLYVEDYSDYVLTKEPQGRWENSEGDECDKFDEDAHYVEPEQYYFFERSDILKIIFDKELISYL